MLYRKPNWAVDGRSWPHRDASRFVRAGGLVWHVQRFADEPGRQRSRKILLIHGTGASTHSWRHLIPLLVAHGEVVAFDLPGHGFTSSPQGRDLSIKGMGRVIGALLQQLEFEPDIIIGHSAGAVLGVELALKGFTPTAHIIAINGAFKPFEGLAAKVFPAAAKLIALNPLTIHGLSAGAQDPKRVRKLLEGTGSKIEPEGLAQYTALFAASGHVAAVLGMMARWDLAELAPRLAKLTNPFTLIVGEGDLAVPPRDAADIQAVLPNTRVIRLPNLGHLAHEEDADAVAKAIFDVADIGQPSTTRKTPKVKSTAS